MNHYKHLSQVKGGKMEWPFWTKLIVVGIGFTGGFVFMYIQCKMYLQLCSRWRAYNRVIYVQNCPNNKPSPLDSNHSSRHVVVEFDENDKVLRVPIKADLERVPSDGSVSNKAKKESCVRQNSINDDNDNKRVSFDRYVNSNENWKYKEVSKTRNDVISTNSHKYTPLSTTESSSHANNNINKIVSQTYNLENFDFSLINNKKDNEQNICARSQDSFEENAFCLVHPMVLDEKEVDLNGASIEQLSNNETHSLKKPKDKNVDIEPSEKHSHFEVISQRIDDKNYPINTNFSPV